MFILENHVSHLRNKSEEDLNRLLRMVVDIDNIGTAMTREENPETKKVYTCLFHVCIVQFLSITIVILNISMGIVVKTMITIYQLLRKCILTHDTPIVESSLGQPPFEKPCIHKAISNLLVYKFHHLPQPEWETMCEVARILLQCLNTWEFPSPSSQKHIVSSFNYLVVIIISLWP